MTFVDPNLPKNDDGFVDAPQPATESYAQPELTYRAPSSLPYTPQQPAKKSKVWVVVLVIALVLLCCCCLIAGLGYYFFYYLGYTLEDFTLLSPLLTLI